MRAPATKSARVKSAKVKPVRPQSARGKRVRDGSGNRAIEAALAALAHDIRTPLTGILALAELLSASELGERERRWAKSIKSAAEHLARLTTVVCDAVRADVAGLNLNRDAFSPRRLAETLGETLVARAEISRLTAEISIASDLPPLVIGDAVRLRAALENLVDNAVKFTARGGVRLAVTAISAGRKLKLCFAVTDSGIGMSADEIAKLFRPFAQADESISRRFGGSGLGLALVHRLARAMGGDLEVMSTKGVGSTFLLTALVEPAPATGKSPSTKGKAVAMPHGGVGLNILCAEDNPYGRVVLNTILAELGHHVDFVGSGTAAVESARRGTYDLVLMDVTLPGIDGVEATARIRALPGPAGTVPIIGISAMSSDADRERALAAGMNAYLVKPVSPVTLAQAIGAIGS